MQQIYTATSHGIESLITLGMTNTKKPRLLIQLPTLLNYRVSEFSLFSEAFTVGIAYTPKPNSEGYLADESDYISDVTYFRTKDAFLRLGSVTYQKGLISAIRKFKPDILFIQSNVRYASFWTALIFCKIYRIKLVGHGQGLYRLRTPGLLRSFIYWLHISLSDAYACYTKISKESLGYAPINQQKLYLTENTIKNNFPITPNQKTGEELGILYLGRLRERCGIEELIKAIDDARKRSGKNFNLHIVGGGVHEGISNLSTNQQQWVHLHGPIYSDSEIAEVSQNCFTGVYPGDAGLSVVHYMSLSLPPIVHNDIYRHMGPEPSYIIDGVNGLQFSTKNPALEISRLIRYLHDDQNLLSKLRTSSFNKYKSLSNPGLGRSLMEVFHAVLKNQAS